MAQRRKARKKSISWELVGIMAVLGVFLVGGLYWIVSPGDRIVSPDFSSLDPAYRGDGEPSPNVQSSLDEDGRPVLGNPDALVTIYEFADFQCPHCREFTVGVGKDIKSDYIGNGQAKMVWVNAPFGGNESRAAARGGYCAAAQGVFWEFHDLLFQNQPTLSNAGGYSKDRLIKMAEMSGAETAAFQSCLEDVATDDLVEDDVEFLRDQGIDSTPSFLIGESLVVGSDGLQLRETLDSAIDAANQGGALAPAGAVALDHEGQN